MCGDYMYRFRTEGGGGLDGWGCTYEQNQERTDRPNRKQNQHTTHKEQHAEPQTDTMQRECKRIRQ